MSRPFLRPVALLLALAGAAFLAGCDAADPTAGGDEAALTAEPGGAPPEASADAAAGRPFRCDQTNLTRPEYYESVTGSIVRGVPVDVLVFRTNFPDRQESYRQRARALPGYQPVDPGYRAWNVTGHPPGDPTNDYVLVLPLYLPPAGPFSGELHVYFNHGQYGWWQTLQGCTFL
jgi:hypothetical protein